MSLSSRRLMPYASALGVYEGNAYEALWNKVQTEPLNQSEVPDGYLVRVVPFCLDELSKASFAGVHQTSAATRSKTGYQLDETEVVNTDITICLPRDCSL